MESNIKKKLDIARKELLDLSNRNRLLNTPRYKDRSRYIEIVDETSEKVFNKLVLERKAMLFSSARPKPDNGSINQPLPIGISINKSDINENNDGELRIGYNKNRLQTLFTPQRLHKKLLSVYYSARTYQEEQGVNILYLAFGMLKWFESESSEREYYAPLILIPVILDRESARSKFKLSYDERDISTNLSLQARLKNDFGIILPEIEDIDDL